MAAPGFAETVRLIGRNQEVPSLQVAVYPGPFELHTDAELAENTTKVVFPQIVDTLTKQIKTEAAKATRCTGSQKNRELGYH